MARSVLSTQTFPGPGWQRTASIPDPNLRVFVGGQHAVGTGGVVVASEAYRTRD